MAQLFRFLRTAGLRRHRRSLDLPGRHPPRAGPGRYLLQQAIAHAPQIGVNTLLGFIFGHNAPSLALFASLGFERWGNLPRVAVLDGVERDLVILGRHLTKPAE